jgi:PAS domain S-box-containing protein
MMVRVEGAAVVLMDETGTVRHWSEGATTLFGHDAGAMTGHSMEAFIPPEFRDRHWRGWARAWAAGVIDVPPAMVPVLCRDGAVRHFAGRLLPVRNAAGDLVAAMGVWSAASDTDEGLPVIS